MLHVFRKYQKIIYILITFVIVVSFSFFGTYSTLEQHAVEDPVIFTTMTGHAVHRFELEEMRNFLATDADDALLYQGRWGPNFLNDGVITKDFIRSGIALPLITAFQEDFREPLSKRLQAEKKAKLYEHPQGKFLNTLNAWAYFSPEMKKNYELLTSGQDALDPKMLQARMNLFMEQKNFSPMMLRQVLKYQMQQYPWLSADPELEQGDLSLFGYHLIENWFGREFTTLAAEMVINGAALAEKKGYVVSKEEAWAELLNNARSTFSRLRSQPNFKVASSEAYLEEQLRLMRLDRTMATAIWRQVLLFRRLMGDIGGAALVDAAIYRDFVDYAKLTASGDIYRLPSALRFSDPAQLEKLDIYLQKLTKGKMNSADLPTNFISVQEAIQKAPELVQKHYTLKIGQVDERSLMTKISIKEMWDWQLTHWDLPDVGAPHIESRDQRFAFLQQLSDANRAKADAYAREKILKEHPEWLKEALASVPKETLDIALTFAGVQKQLSGVTDPQALMVLLNSAPTDGSLSEALQHYSPDGKITYTIEVVDNSQQPEILLFAEALERGIMDSLLQKELEAHYVKIREQRKTEFSQANGGWKPLAEVSKEVAADRFATLFKGKAGTPKETAVSYLLPAMQKMREALVANPSDTKWFREVSDEKNGAKETPPLLQDQWKLLKSSYAVDRSDFGEAGLESGQIFALQPGNWTSVSSSALGDMAFFHLKDFEKRQNLEELGNKVLGGQALIASESQKAFFRTRIDEMKVKGELTLEFFRKNEES